MSKVERAAVVAVATQARETINMARYVRFADGRDEAARIVLDECAKALG